jgi:hypothetical protein
MTHPEPLDYGFKGGTLEIQGSPQMVGLLSLIRIVKPYLVLQLTLE